MPSSSIILGRTEEGESLTIAFSQDHRLIMVLTGDLAQAHTFYAGRLIYQFQVSHTLLRLHQAEDQVRRHYLFERHLLLAESEGLPLVVVTTGADLNFIPHDAYAVVCRNETYALYRAGQPEPIGFR